MLVINGVDAQTNSHTVGIVHNWSGRNAEGYPTTTALLAAHYAAGPPGTVPELRRILRNRWCHPLHAHRHDANLLRDIANPATQMFTEADWAELESVSGRHRGASRGRAQSVAG